MFKFPELEDREKKVERTIKIYQHRGFDLNPVNFTLNPWIKHIILIKTSSMKQKNLDQNKWKSDTTWDKHRGGLLTE